MPERVAVRSSFSSVIVRIVPFAKRETPSIRIYGLMTLPRGHRRTKSFLMKLFCINLHTYEEERYISAKMYCSFSSVFKLRDKTRCFRY